MPLLAQELENGRVLKTNDPAYEWAEAEAKKLLAKQKGQTVFDCFKLAPNPTYNPDGDRVAFYLTNSVVVVWDPEKAWPEHIKRNHFCCTKCGGKTTRKGRSKMRRVCGLKGHFYFCGIKYSCQKCSKSEGGSGSTCFDSKHPDILARLPDWVQTQLPVILTTNGAIDRDMMELINYDVTNGQGFQASSERIATSLYRQHAQNQLSYLQLHASKQQPGQQPKVDAGHPPKQPPPQFEQLGSAGFAKPYIPSPQYLSSAWLEAVKPQLEWAKRHMSAVTGKFICLDHTFRVAKYVRRRDGKQAYKCVLTVYNELGLVLGQYFTYTTSMLEVEDALRKIAARYKDGDGPEVHLPAMLDVCLQSL